MIHHYPEDSLEICNAHRLESHPSMSGKELLCVLRQNCKFYYGYVLVFQIAANGLSHA